MYIIYLVYVKIMHVIFQVLIIKIKNYTRKDFLVKRKRKIDTCQVCLTDPCRSIGTTWWCDSSHESLCDQIKPRHTSQKC